MEVYDEEKSFLAILHWSFFQVVPRIQPLTIRIWSES